MIDALCAGAEASGADVAVGLVEQRTLLAAYPGNRRTWLRFRGGAYSGANLFWIASARALPALRLWRTIEQQRKRGRAIIAAFGPWMLAGVALRLLTLRGALARGGAAARAGGRAGRAADRGGLHRRRYARRSRPCRDDPRRARIAGLPIRGTIGYRRAQ